MGFCNLLIINVFKNALGLTANFGERDRKFLLANFKISPRNLRSNFPVVDIFMKNLDNFGKRKSEEFICRHQSLRFNSSLFTFHL